MRAENLFAEKVKFQDVRIQLPSYVYFIAEIGINHNGDLDLAKQLIDVAVNAGCDAVKFQKRTINKVYSAEELDKPRESPWGKTQRDQKNGLEFGREEYDEINNYCKAKGIEWSASAWDEESLIFIDGYAPPFHKIASAMTTKLDFVRSVALMGRPTFMSLGMCTYFDIDAAVETFLKENDKLILFHTVSTYPSRLEDLNLLQINELSKRYNLPVGYSGHEANVSPSIAAVALGAVAIERHITISRAIYGSDQAASLEPTGLNNLLGAIRKIGDVRGDGIRREIADESIIARKLRYWEKL